MDFPHTKGWTNLITGEDKENQIAGLLPLTSTLTSTASELLRKNHPLVRQSAEPPKDWDSEQVSFDVQRRKKMTLY